MESFPRMGNTPSGVVAQSVGGGGGRLAEAKVMFTLVLMVDPDMAGLWRSLMNVP